MTMAVGGVALAAAEARRVARHGWFAQDVPTALDGRHDAVGGSSARA
jgi:hypothetical protein